jgi:hypothetical protein
VFTHVANTFSRSEISRLRTASTIVSSFPPVRGQGTNVSPQSLSCAAIDRGLCAVRLNACWGSA